MELIHKTRSHAVLMDVYGWMRKPLVQAVAYGKVQERNSKIEGSTYNLPTWACHTGSKLAKVAGSVCEKCYATAIEKGIRGATVRASVQANLDAWLQAQASNDYAGWCVAIASQIMAISNRKRNRSNPAKQVGWDQHRWFSGGDCHDYDMFVCIMNVARMTPKIQHWFPTKEKQFVLTYLRQHGSFPPNMCVRLSDPMIDGDQQFVQHGYTRAAVQRHTDMAGYKCPATFNKSQKSCDGCTACWDKKIGYVIYKFH